MRLGQLARKLEVKPVDIVKYLASEHKTEMNSHPNSKVDDELVSVISVYFMPVKREVELIKEVVDSSKIETPIKEEITEIKVENIEDSVSPIEQEEIIKAENIEHIETIRPEALTGPKIISKIELPPPPPLEMIEIDGVMMEKSEYRKKKAEEYKQRKEAARKKSIASGYAKRLTKERSDIPNEFTTEKENKREEKELEKRRKKREEAVTKKRKEHYVKNHITSSASKKKKKAKTQNIDPLFTEEIQESTSSIALTEPKQSLLKRLWKWFNT